jgi:hypothetical protein
MSDFIDYQQRSDDNFLKYMADQQAAERELRDKECKAFTGAIGMLASAIAGQSNPSNSSQHVGSQRSQQYNIILCNSRNYPYPYISWNLTILLHHGLCLAT